MGGATLRQKASEYLYFQQVPCQGTEIEADTSSAEQDAFNSGNEKLGSPACAAAVTENAGGTIADTAIEAPHEQAKEDTVVNTTVDRSDASDEAPDPKRKTKGMRRKGPRNSKRLTSVR